MASVSGVSAPLASEVFAVLEVALAAVLLGGLFAARAGRIRLHRALQSTVILANLPIALGWMVPSYLAYVRPGVPSDLGTAYGLLPTLMLFAGGLAEALGVYILLVAGTNLLPERWRFRRYKRWMRVELVLWWAVVLLGLSTYLVWYYPPASG